MYGVSCLGGPPRCGGSAGRVCRGRRRSHQRERENTYGRSRMALR